MSPSSLSDIKGPGLYIRVPTLLSSSHLTVTLGRHFHLHHNRALLGMLLRCESQVPQHMDEMVLSGHCRKPYRGIAGATRRTR